MTFVTLTTVGLGDGRRHHSAAELARYQLAEVGIGHRLPDVAAVPQLPGHYQADAGASLLRPARPTFA